MRRKILLLLLASTVACGRAGSSEGLRGRDSGASGSGDASQPVIDSGLPFVDGGTTPTDGGPGFDAGELDGGLECVAATDCFALHGRPPLCPDGRRGRWACENSACINECGPPMPDGGPMRDGGPPMRDGGMRRDGGPGRPDTGIPDSGQADSGLPLDPDAGPSSSTPVGAECENMSMACGPDGFCIAESDGFPGGYCSEDCGMMNAMCPGDAICRRLGPNNAACLDGCLTNMDCREGYACVQLGLGQDRVCWPVPVGSMNPMGAPVGDACTMDGDCDQGLTCLDPMGPGWNDGYCTQQFCDVTNNPCPSGSLCYNFPRLVSLCLVECPSGGSQSTCRPGYYCLGPTGSPGVCTTN